MREIVGKNLYVVRIEPTGLKIHVAARDWNSAISMVEKYIEDTGEDISIKDAKLLAEHVYMMVQE